MNKREQHTILMVKLRNSLGLVKIRLAVETRLLEDDPVGSPAEEDQAWKTYSLLCLEVEARRLGEDEGGLVGVTTSKRRYPFRSWKEQRGHQRRLISCQ